MWYTFPVKEVGGVNREEYLRDPCGASSLPWWKGPGPALAEDIRVVREDAFDPEEWKGWRDEKYFKLMHGLRDLERPILPAGFCPGELEAREYARHIALCYEREGVTEAELAQYRARPVYAPELWVSLVDGTTRAVAASGIGEMDPETGEGTLEWIQVTPCCRRRGLGEWLVRELLWRMRGRAKFATVSGRVDNPSNPMGLYEKCGFSGRVIWHVLRKDTRDGGQEI